MLLLVILSIRRKTLFNQSKYKYYIDINKCMLEILSIRRKTIFNQSKYTLY